MWDRKLSYWWIGFLMSIKILKKNSDLKYYFCPMNPNLDVLSMYIQYSMSSTQVTDVKPFQTRFPTIPFNGTYSILLSAPTRAALGLTKRVIGWRVTGVGWGLWWRTLPGGRGRCCTEAELWLVLGQTESILHLFIALSDVSVWCVVGWC